MSMRLTSVDNDDDGFEEEEEEETPCCEGERRQAIDELFDFLPATGIEEWAGRMGIEEWELTNRLTHLRRNGVEHGWTVPHAPRGPNSTGRDRFFAAMVTKGGQAVFDPEALESIKDGAVGTILHTAASATNAALGLRSTALHTRRPLEKAKLNGLAEDFEYLGRRAHGIAEEFGWEANGG